ncbi:MAG: hypothetical protein CVU69_00325 [Deltaproteobacteria bacterium HGW-Deltaproteobacteria-4]|nr:MAG: hypothetical protein CVU69_00325 [Deltaproteobacteria bacterium HGW-Deltaproteobacteria-4]
MNRRDFLKMGASGLTMVAVGTMADWPLLLSGSPAYASHLARGRLELDMVAVDAEMVDGVLVPMWAFTLAETGHAAMVGGARIPGTGLIALEGDRIRLRITNSVGQGGAHGFAIPGVPLTVAGTIVNQVTIPSGGDHVDIEFTAPAAGTYMYLDPLNAPVNRVMGLHGSFIVLPNPIGNNTPYGNPTNRVQRLFDDLGSTAHFPGNPWDPMRNVVWMFNVIDPVKCAAAAVAAAINPTVFLTGFLPQYFTINGKSGYFSAQHAHGMTGDITEHEEETRTSFAEGLFDLQRNISARGSVGQPMLIRTLNVGLMWQSPHIHGNHVYPLSHANALSGSRQISNNLTMLDTWSIAPGDIKDVLLPFIQPPDIPAATWSRLANDTSDELFPLVYPMHDHNELSNTAAGGNYPFGAATHWQIDGPYDSSNPDTAVVRIDKAEVRLKTGQLLIEGRCTVPGLMLAMHGGGHSGPMLNQMIHVGNEAGSDGRFRFHFRGRALKALATRTLTIMHHDEITGMEHVLASVPLKVR